MQMQCPIFMRTDVLFRVTQEWSMLFHKYRSKQLGKFVIDNHISNNNAHIIVSLYCMDNRHKGG